MVFHGFSLFFIVFHCFSVFSWFFKVFHGFFMVVLWFAMVFSKNWISKNWKSIDIHCWTSINEYQWISIDEFIDGHPSMNSLMDIHELIDGPSMNMVPFLWAPSLGPFLWAPWGPGPRGTHPGQATQKMRFFNGFP